MTEYEAASLVIQQDTLALQQATLSFQQASLALQESALAVQRASVWVTALVGAAQCAVAGHGLSVLHRYYKHSAEQHRETMKALEDRNNAMMELVRLH